VPSLDHLTIAAADLEVMLACYDAALGALGVVRVTELVDEEEDEAAVEAVGYGTEGGLPQVWLLAGAPATSGVHLSFRAPDRAAVEAFHEAAIGAGATPFSTPRRWPIYRRGEFNAIVRDPQGNLLEAVADE
jgi:catechol 2,3-dioxygenase-like lactoylglutathione lyase family enzyme